MLIFSDLVKRELSVDPFLLVGVVCPNAKEFTNVGNGSVFENTEPFSFGVF
jgi:hypothetical protein